MNTEHNHDRPIAVPHRIAIQNEDVAHIEISDEEITKIRSIMTPEELLVKQDFQHPYVITPFMYYDFKALLRSREHIRNLELLPVKTDEERAQYKGIQKNALLDEVASYLGDSDIALAINKYPYYLPPDVAQYIVWLRNANTDRKDAEQFITKMAVVFGASLDDLILFERPLGIDSKLVRGTLPEFRHIHFWVNAGILK